MLIDISGNTFSSLGNTAPTVIYTPPQIFGTGLYTWYDFNDKSTLYTDSGATTNVVNDNDNILFVRNKGYGGYGRNYNLIFSGNASLANVHKFKPNLLNTNKNACNFTASTTTISLKTISGFLLSSATSSYTFSFCYKSPSSTGNVYLMSLNNISSDGFNQVAALWYEGTGNYYRCLVKWGTSPQSSNLGGAAGAISGITWTPRSIPATELKYNVITMTINSGSTVTLYHNDTDITAVTGNENIHPISTVTMRGGSPASIGSQQQFAINWARLGGSLVPSASNTQILEICTSESVCLDANQVKLLHQYYRTKYNILL